MHRRVFTLVSLLLIAGLAGCLSDGDRPTAMAGRGAAERAIEDDGGLPGAQLVGVFALEASTPIEHDQSRRTSSEPEADDDADDSDEPDDHDHDDHGDGNHNATAENATLDPYGRSTMQQTIDPVTDGQPGDGLSASWIYVFEAGNETRYVHVESGQAKVLPSAPADMNIRLPGGPIEDWNVDSDEAARRLHSVPEFVAALGGRNVSVLSILGQDPQADRPVWFLSVASQHGNETRETGFLVDADEGEVLAVGDVPIGLFAPAPGVPAEIGRFSGMLSLLDGSVQHAFAIAQPGHDQLIVNLEAQFPLPLAELEFSVIGPDGQGGTESGPAFPALFDGRSLVILEPTPGLWNVEVRFEGILESYAVSYCAAGFGADLGGRDPCDAY